MLLHLRSFVVMLFILILPFVDAILQLCHGQYDLGALAYQEGNMHPDHIVTVGYLPSI